MCLGKVNWNIYFVNNVFTKHYRKNRHKQNWENCDCHSRILESYKPYYTVQTLLNSCTHYSCTIHSRNPVVQYVRTIRLYNTVVHYNRTIPYNTVGNYSRMYIRLALQMFEEMPIIVEINSFYKWRLIFGRYEDPQKDEIVTQFSDAHDNRLRSLRLRHV